MRKKLIIVIILLIALAIFISLSFSSNKEQVNYLTERVTRGDLTRTVNATGEVSAVQVVSVGAQVSGQIEVLAVSVGQDVRRGDLIAQIDSTTQENELALNKARLNTYNSQLISRKVALKVAQLQYEREKELRAKNATSQENLENAENALAAAEAAVDETNSLIVQTQISVNTSETNLGYTRITAPLDGTVVSVPVEQGQTVNANQTTPTIVQVADLSQMEIRMQISEGDVTKVKPGMRVTYTILSEPNRIFEGILKAVDPGLTTLSDGGYSGSIDSGTAIYYYGKLLVDNSEGILRIGMTTQNTIIIDSLSDVLLVPTIAINLNQGQSTVRVMENGVPVERVIKVGISDNMYTQVLEGLKEGQEVVAVQMSAAEMTSSRANTPFRGPRI